MQVVSYHNQHFKSKRSLLYQYLLTIFLKMKRKHLHPGEVAWVYQRPLPSLKSVYKPQLLTTQKPRSAVPVLLEGMSALMDCSVSWKQISFHLERDRGALPQQHGETLTHELYHGATERYPQHCRMLQDSTTRIIMDCGGALPLRVAMECYLGATEGYHLSSVIEN